MKEIVIAVHERSALAESSIEFPRVGRLGMACLDHLRPVHCSASAWVPWFSVTRVDVVVVDCGPRHARAA